MRLIKSGVIALLTLFAHAAWADTTLTITNVRAFETAPTAMTGGGYMEITNTGTTDDRLIDIQADFPRVQIHTTAFSDGVARMRHVDGITIKAGETVVLAPGGYHVMFMGLQGNPMILGETFPATLIFENAGAVQITFTVVAREMPANH